MADTTFVDEVTVIEPAWLNDINDHVYNGLAPHAAADVANTPSGNLSATDVQGALNELQSSIDAGDVAVAMAIALG